MAVRLTSGGTTIYLRNPKRGNIYNRQKAHAVGRSAAGTFYSYYKGIDIKTLRLEFEELYNSEKTELDGFFGTTVVGPSNTFTYVDQDGTSWTARFLNDSLEFEEITDEVNTITTYSSGGVSYPTTTRKTQIWKVSFELEVS